MLPHLILTYQYVISTALMLLLVITKTMMKKHPNIDAAALMVNASVCDIDGFNVNVGDSCDDDDDDDSDDDGGGGGHESDDDSTRW
jgi:hypothetical protein